MSTPFTLKTRKIVYGYCRAQEKLLNSKTIPAEIVSILIRYYHISPIQIISNPNVLWSDIVSLNSVKMALKERIVLPLKFPLLFSGKRKPFYSLMIYGPSGCGKTYSIQAAATESQSKLLYIDIKQLLIEYDDNSATAEIKRIFEIARDDKPCIICIDPLELLSTNNDSFKCLKTELLLEMVSRDNDKIEIIGLSKEPWNIDPSLRRRFTKRIYAQLPDKESRKALFDQCLKDIQFALSDEEYAILIKETDGLSYHEICCIVQTVRMNHKMDESLSSGLKLEIAKITQPSATKKVLEKFKNWSREFAQEW